MALFGKPMQIPSAHDALPGRSQRIRVAPTHFAVPLKARSRWRLNPNLERLLRSMLASERVRRTFCFS